MDMNTTKKIETSSSAQEEPSEIFSEGAPDWRIWLGLSITVIWLVVLSLYVSSTVGWSNIGNAPIETVGNFLEGAFAPLAFLWLVIGYFLQKKELFLNTQAIKMQHAEIQKSAEQAVIQSQAIKATELHTRRESFLKIAENVNQQLGSILGMLFISSQGVDSDGIMGNKKLSELWGSLNKNDPEVFSRSLLELQAMHGERYGYKLFYGTEIRTTHSETFIQQFERLIKATEDLDQDGMIKDSFLGTAHGIVYRLVTLYRENPPEGFTYGVYDFDPDSLDGSYLE